MALVMHLSHGLALEMRQLDNMAECVKNPHGALRLKIPIQNLLSESNLRQK